MSFSIKNAIICTMTKQPKYELVRHAGEVNYEAWAARGIKVPILDKDGTVTAVNEDGFSSVVTDAMRDGGISELFEAVALVSNNHDPEAVKKLSKNLTGALGIKVIYVCQADGYARKPSPQMGLHVAEILDVNPAELGVIGDRRFTDVTFGLRVGAGAIALCNRLGDHDARGVAPIRWVEENIVVPAERALGRAA